MERGGEERWTSPAERLSRWEGDRREYLYGQMVAIRHFEERLLALFEEGEVAGTTHACIGQEANAVGVLNHLRRGDMVFSNHRCHGHFLVYSGAPRLLAAEVLGREGGVVRGRGGSQHICYRDFYSNGIQGGIAPVGVGMAMAEKEEGGDGVMVICVGDGTFGEGALYEAMNMASLWSAPVLFLVEHNEWAQSTPTHRQMAGDIEGRARGFGLDVGAVESTDVEVIDAHFEEVFEGLRKEGRPRMEVIHTYRLCHHSKSDDNRPREEVEARRSGDPLPLMGQRLSPQGARAVEARARAPIDEAYEWALEQPMADPQGLQDPLAMTTREERLWPTLF